MSNEEYELLNIIYDLIAQNPIKGVYNLTHDDLTELVDHVDEETKAIVFINKHGKTFELKLIETYAPSEASARSSLTEL